MMWRRLEFLGSILELGYNFLFTEMDIMWLRDPYSLIYSRKRVHHHQTRPVCHRRTRSHDAVS
ncbi:BnaA04g20500D [Brassica napus]|uniref:BnaA04g20500D protein n=2 Tax=Brassica napus TaxID=3708 RepID=A0A078I1G9_BRANA|nr:BnaA04g20500D [Brassica napus]